MKARQIMAMTASAIRFEQDEKEWINTFAQLNGNSFSAQVRQWTLERLEDEMDAYDLKMAIAKDNGERIPFEKVIADLEIAI
ncbi:type II toxin-antitoxin system RelB family antitoxin [Adlercreutzia sp. ZJ154]|uniref:type II toxin-antitoxin system RelB family antitoxin n=1 Tax=Adlercreutzia sp. ZJ154 TaxID=2709790 RepID=UPI001F150427|nr:DUF6290 family protein [Adlercreutzia sp. ZJ154]